MKKNRISLVLAVIFVFSLFGAAAFAASDNILSGNIKEADGTTGQDTNTGSGVKTGHIQDGAVTDAKITGPISASKIQDGVFQKKYAKVAVVAQSGGDYTSPVTAMSSYLSWCGVPSATNPCLLKIMPGVYDIASATVTMRNHVDVEGSGENATIITGQGSVTVTQAPETELRFLTVENNTTSPHDAYGIALGPTGGPNLKSKITNVTAIVSNSSEDVTAVAVSVGGDVPVEMTNVKAIVTSSHRGGSAIYLSSSNPSILTNVTASITGNGTWQCTGLSSYYSDTTIRDSVVSSSNCYSHYGILGFGSTVTISDTTVESTGTGVQGNGASVVRIDHSSIYGGTNSIVHPFPVYVAYSKIYGGPFYDLGGLLKCIGTYDNNYDPVTCP